MNKCQCCIGPRKYPNDFILYCPQCCSAGGSMGNVNHNPNCIYKECDHNLLYWESNDEDNFGWLEYGPDKKSREKHLKLRRVLLSEIKSEILKIEHSLFLKVFEIVSLKTGCQIQVKSNT